MKNKVSAPPSVSYTFTVRLRFENRVGKLAGILSEAMKLAAARAIADGISAAELNEEYIVPSVFNRRVARQVARAVAAAADRSGVARRRSS